MKIPAEFDDIFLGIELTEREARFLDWITGWDDYTIQNMRTVLEKVRSDVSEIRSENEKLKADLARIVDEVDAAGDRMQFVETKSGIVVYAGTDGLFAKRGNRS